jgi:hypothetical protein
LLTGRALRLWTAGLLLPVLAWRAALRALRALTLRRTGLLRTLLLARHPALR